ncbi:DUF1642 domain-containing protein [Lacticaseibacillus paracasei]|uniref:DUF1642 domain-containing protein n=1 Tax=Lacticaseibacillus paracasei TaxID=1597 RepID=UPI0021A29B61|nr:DUF1642 domain-containing protein [Lacticaseibacillus paracasei]MCT4385056.1 hypothetical protein [Lacticaseibacillus paracasei]
MSNETKREVLVDAVDALADAQASGGNVGHQDADLFMYDYDAALPDDLPVIPKAVGEYIRKVKAPGKWGLLDVFWHLGDNISAVGINGLYDWQRWMADNQVAVARAWVLGVWRVEETGEIVKLEAEK